jgi:PKHD-type hydroxylase
LSLTVNLSNPESYKGGELQFFTGDAEPYDAPKKQGSVICFDCHDWHQVAPVTEGTRYSLVLWIWGPNFL